MLLLLACVTADPKETPGDDSASVSDSATTPDTIDTLPEELNGVAPDEDVALPEFVATNQVGEGRGPEDLLGRPAVMWFYPAANTAG